MNMLTGCELVQRGTTKIDATLPELGVKEVTPNGTWLEQKQIQAAIEARKKLIEIQRIEKKGAMSHAVWKDNLKLAEVTHKVGGHWQHMGHNIGKQLYIRAEEILFLMELNCLYFKFNDVVVSLQQAYSLFLGPLISHQQYKVYASLSRLGYRVYRHETSDKEIHNPSTSNNVNKVNIGSSEASCSVGNPTMVNIKLERMDEYENIQIKQEPDTEEYNAGDVNHGILSVPIKKEFPQSDSDMETSASNSIQGSSQDKSDNMCCKIKLKNLKSRKLKPCSGKVLHKYFNNLPELIGTSTVIVKKPNIMYLPINVILKRVEYTVNLLNIREKGERTDVTETNIYNEGDEVNGSHVRRLRSSASRSDTDGTGQSNMRFPSQNPQYRPYNMWRDRHSFNYFNFNMFFQRNFSPPWYTNSNCQFTPRNHAYPRPTLSVHNRITPQTRKRPKNNTQKQHLDGIKKLSAKLKLLLQKGNMDPVNIQSLQRLIHLYNRRYKARMRISPDFDIVDENVLDTIDLDDEEPAEKRRRNNDDQAYKENLEQLKQLASKLKSLEENKKSSARHRRALSKLLKVFNESYKEEYYLSEEHEIKNPRHITLDTSESESDVLMNEDTPNRSKGKKVKNPFNILKRLTEKQKDGNTSSTSDDCDVQECKKYSDVLAKTFSKGWLPREDDFGRAEVVKKDSINMACNHDEKDLRREEFMYDFLKIQSTKTDDWLNLKNETIKSEDNSLASVLRKLTIIRRDDSLNDECNLKIDFDVYNRDVQNFRKTNRPTPHFRLIALDESSTIPSGQEIATLASKYNDDVAIIFAVVGMNSIGFIQIKPTVLPVFLPNES
ncbi:putative tRNA-splicing endonuclease subunit Sen54 [Danaus plexippus plexippus]|uniref:tRNA-splicing endonuclease subunit Sen54 n=1 Tax=Danaus plexippus plexippus TaxID=278856 RepID=A0A212ETY5_DANPL|nr:putative tRNA-splicing endonuclease subunit Sen54 [Danaus plexippus plexippus]